MSGFSRIVLSILCLAVVCLAAGHASAQARGMDQQYREEELTNSDRQLRQLQQEQPQLFQQILSDINRDTKARDPASVEELAAASPALEDLNRSSPEALLGLFLLLKGAARQDGKGTR